MTQSRQALADVRRIVVKIGSRSVRAPGRFAAIASQFDRLRKGGRTALLVSSGAIAMGYRRLGLEERPTAVALLQASAAAGQSALMRAYEDAFGEFDISVGQVLLTHATFSDRDRYLNARSAIRALLEHGIVPIVNENDTVAVEEITFGDNDKLASLVAGLAGADLLVVLTDVEGVLDEAGQRISSVQDMKEVDALIRPAQQGDSLGGMASKLESSFAAARHGIPVVIGSAANPNLLDEILAGNDVGTLVLPKGTPLASRKHWIATSLHPRGAVVVDNGAKAALVKRQGSLLPAGVIGVRGSFEVADAVDILGLDGEVFARGLARYDVRDVAVLARAQTDEIEERLGRHGGKEIVHRDDLVLI